MNFLVNNDQNVNEWTIWAKKINVGKWSKMAKLTNMVKKRSKSPIKATMVKKKKDQNGQFGQKVSIW